MHNELHLTLVVSLVATLGFSLGCARSPDAAPASSTSTPAQHAPETTATKPAMVAAELGKPAPDFTLQSVDGKTVRLSEHKGKIVVLEWFNPDCPFVRNLHTKASLKNASERSQQADVVWLAINSAAAGKQGHGVEHNAKSSRELGMSYPVLIDDSGDVGRAYDSKRTPHMYVIDAKGILVYRGAIDNSPDGEGQSPSDGKLVDYVEAALSDIRAGRAVQRSETEAYGCSVKY